MKLETRHWTLVLSRDLIRRGLKLLDKERKRTTEALQDPFRHNGYRQALLPFPLESSLYGEHLVCQHIFGQLFLWNLGDTEFRGQDGVVHSVKNYCASDLLIHIFAILFCQRLEVADNAQGRTVL
jgi:hypothetical protein